MELNKPKHNIFIWLMILFMMSGVLMGPTLFVVVGVVSLFTGRAPDSEAVVLVAPLLAITLLIWRNSAVSKSAAQVGHVASEVSLNNYRADQTVAVQINFTPSPRASIDYAFVALLSRDSNDEYREDICIVREPIQIVPDKAQQIALEWTVPPHFLPASKNSHWFVVLELRTPTLWHPLLYEQKLIIDPNLKQQVATHLETVSFV